MFCFPINIWLPNQNFSDKWSWYFPHLLKYKIETVKSLYLCLVKVVILKKDKMKKKDKKKWKVINQDCWFFSSNFVSDEKFPTLFYYNISSTFKKKKMREISSFEKLEIILRFFKLSEKKLPTFQKRNGLKIWFWKLSNFSFNKIWFFKIVFNLTSKVQEICFIFSKRFQKKRTFYSL